MERSTQIVMIFMIDYDFISENLNHHNNLRASQIQILNYKNGMESD